MSNTLKVLLSVSFAMSLIGITHYVSVTSPSNSEGINSRTVINTNKLVINSSLSKDDELLMQELIDIRERTNDLLSQSKEDNERINKLLENSRAIIEGCQ